MQSVAFQIHLVQQDTVGFQRPRHIGEGGIEVVDMLQHGARENEIHLVLQFR